MTSSHWSEMSLNDVSVLEDTAGKLFTLNNSEV